MHGRGPMRFSEDDAKKFDIKLFFWLWKYIQQHKFFLIGLLLLTTLYSLLSLAGPYLSKIAIDKYIRGGDAEGLLRFVLMYLALMCTIFFANYAQVFLMTLFGQKIMYKLRLDIFDHLNRLPKSYFDKNPIGKIMTRVTSDVESLAELLTSGVATLAGDFLMLGGIIVVLLLINVKLTLVLLAMLPILLIGMRIFRIKITPLYRKERELNTKIIVFLQESIVGMSIIQLFNRQKRNMADFDENNESYYDVSVKSLMVNASFYPFVNFLSIAGKALIIWYGGVQFLKLNISVGEIVAFLTYVEMFFRPLVDLSEKYNIFQAAMAASEKISQVMHEPQSPIYATENGYAKPLVGNIEFRNVWFAYNDENWVIKDMSFTIDAGKMVAIVGHTGSGKTTLINLIGRFYDIQKGDIFVDGVNLRDWNIEYLRRHLGIVLQDVFLFSGNVEENITLYNEAITPDRVRKVVESVKGDEFIDKLPQGYETPILERGKSLSVGQRQVLSFARTLAYDPKILVLDEATANIDSETEKYIQHATEKLIEGRTSIVIAHRLSTIKNADTILVLHKGELRESGSHDKLFAQQGLYYDLYQLQYKDQDNEYNSALTT